MLELIAEAIQNHDYQTAQHLIAESQQTHSGNPWLTFYEARLAEVTQDLTRADAIYRGLLPNVINPKLIAHIRQGIQRIETLTAEKEEQKQATRQAHLEQLKARPSNEELAVLILEPIELERKKAIAKTFAQIMKITPYDAILQMPTRAWRLYRTGGLEELQFFADQLNKEDISCFCMPISFLSSIKVYSVRYIESFHPQVTVVYQTEQGSEDRFSFQWSDLKRQVDAHLPLLEKIVTIGRRGAIERKTDTLDFAQFCDFHLSDHHAILRFCDQTYEFNLGMTAAMSGAAMIGQGLAKDRWDGLQEIFAENLLDIPHWSNISNFTVFGESAIEFPEMLTAFRSHVTLLRIEETPWDAAFHLYSSLIWYQQETLKPQ